jgi:hypothetical protein
LPWAASAQRKLMAIIPPQRITDTDYTKCEGYLKRQHEFQERDKFVIDGKEIIKPFVNVHDKGFRVNTTAWSEGQQLVLQPVFS